MMEDHASDPQVRATLDAEVTAAFARATLEHVGREYPHRFDHILTGPQDLLSPAELHPVFHGSLDWHSCVQGWWQLLTIARLFPDLPEAAAIRARADAMLSPDKVAGELGYLDRPGAAAFERPFGWAWALALHGEAARHDAGWAEALEPLARALALRLRLYLPRLTVPVRSGAPENTAFALVLAGDWAALHDPRLAALIRARAVQWFGNDRDCQAWEPGGEDLLSPALCEALLMSRVLPGPDFRGWFAGFLPGVTRGGPATLFTPAVQMHGLNLSRAWCWRQLARELGPGHAGSGRLVAAADRHLSAGLPLPADATIAQQLAAFALLALLA